MLKKEKTPGAFVFTGRWMFVDVFVYFSCAFIRHSI
jgi:hypothetical protein